MPDNSLNTAKGRTFQMIAANLLGQHLETMFALDKPIAIGNPPKLHKFDLVSSDDSWIGECKSYSWTETGNMPSAKMGFINEALLYLSYTPVGSKRFIALRHDRHARRVESIAEYYVRTYRHLIGAVTVYEVDVLTGRILKHPIA